MCFMQSNCSSRWLWTMIWWPTTIMVASHFLIVWLQCVTPAASIGIRLAMESWVYAANFLIFLDSRQSYVCQKVSKLFSITKINLVMVPRCNMIVFKSKQTYHLVASAHLICSRMEISPFRYGSAVHSQLNKTYWKGIWCIKSGFCLIPLDYMFYYFYWSSMCFSNLFIIANTDSVFVWHDAVLLSELLDKSLPVHSINRL